MMETLADQLTSLIIGTDSPRTAAALSFFLFETVKIGLLLLIVTHVMGVVNAAFPVERVRQFIASGRLKGFEHVAASCFGAVTPFCSCSSIPLFIGFLQGGIPLGVTLSFLITSPLVNEVALALLLATFGWKVTLTYAVTGIVLGSVIGWLLGRSGLRSHVEPWVWDMVKTRMEGAQLPRPPLGELLRIASREAVSITRRIAPYVLVGIAIGSIIHGYVPAGALESYLTESNPLGVPISVAIAVPLYSNASGTIPILEALVAKGVPLGTALAFMMAVVGLSLPEAMILRKVMRPKLLGSFFGSVALSIVGLGYFFNLLF